MDLNRDLFNALQKVDDKRKDGLTYYTIYFGEQTIKLPKCLSINPRRFKFPEIDFIENLKSLFSNSGSLKSHQIMKIGWIFEELDPELNEKVVIGGNTRDDSNYVELAIELFPLKETGATINFLKGSNIKRTIEVPLWFTNFLNYRQSSIKDRAPVYDIDLGVMPPERSERDAFRTFNDLMFISEDPYVAFRWMILMNYLGITKDFIIERLKPKLSENNESQTLLFREFLIHFFVVRGQRSAAKDPLFSEIFKKEDMDENDAIILDIEIMGRRPELFLIPSYTTNYFKHLITTWAFDDIVIEILEYLTLFDWPTDNKWLNTLFNIPESWKDENIYKFERIMKKKNTELSKTMHRKLDKTKKAAERKEREFPPLE